jgi:uncharacterized repeat protein (TIGR03803 family)
MENRKRCAVTKLKANLRTSPIAVTLAVAFLAILIAVVPAQAQSFKVIHSFSGQGDSGTPGAGLTPAGAGEFYGTTSGLGIGSNGSVFKLGAAGSGWILRPLNDFNMRDGGARPQDKVTIGPDGNLYGETYLGGQGDCGGEGSCGVVFKMQPPSNACVSFLCQWHQVVLYQFGMPPDAGLPDGDVIFDTAGNLYGVTAYGGSGPCQIGCGAVYKLTPSGGGWTETVIYNFLGGNDGQLPFGGLIMDAAGNLYGTAFGGSAGQGIIYELSPSNGGWTKTTLHTFQGSDGAGPTGSLIADQHGNLYGTTSGGIGIYGTAYELSNPGNWSFQVLYTFPTEYGYGPYGSLVFDNSGNLYGVLLGGAYNDGEVFKLTPSNGGWTATDLHDFQSTDGTNPNGGLVLDSAGNLYGTTQLGGTVNDACYIGCGTIWEITP